MLRRFSVLVIALVAAGCAADVGSNESALEDVAANFSDEVRYIDWSISDRPMTAEEIGDTSTAIPVVVRFYEPGVAIAWSAPNGTAITESLEDAVAIWNVELTRDETVRGPDGTTIRSPGITPGDLYATVGTSIGENHVPNIGIDGTIARVDWLRQRVREFADLPPAFHAGCL
jgi:hypothetical protein